MILAGETLPEQLGAFLMLLRVKEESPAEIAGLRPRRRARRCRPRPTRRASTSTGRPTPAKAGNCRGSSCRRWSWRATAGACSCTARKRTREGRIYTGAALRALGVPGRGKSRRGGRRPEQGEFRLSADRRPEPADRRHAGAAPDPRPALACPHLRAHAQSVRRARDASGRLPSGLHAHPPRRRADPRTAAARRLPRRGRRDRAAAGQTLRRDDGDRGPARSTSAGRR